MRWILFALSAGTLLAASSAVSHAADDPRLEKILDHWKKLPEDLQSCRLSGRRFVYNSVFQIEKRSEFEIHWNRDGRILYLVRAVDIPEEEHSQKLNPRGKAYELKSDDDEVWYWPDDRRVVQIKLESGEALEIETEPVFYNSREHIEFPVHPALSELTPKYEWRITDETDECFMLEGKRVHIRHELSYFASLTEESDKFQTVDLIVRKSDYSIQAVRMWDVARTNETVYVYRQRRTTVPFFSDNAFIFYTAEGEKLRKVIKYYDTPPEQRPEEIKPLRAPKPTHSSGLRLLFVDLTTRLLRPWLP